MGNRPKRSGGRFPNAARGSKTLDLAVQKFAGVYVEFADRKVAVARDKAIAVRIWSKLNIFVNHGLAQIDLPTIETDISPTVHFDHVVFATILILFHFISVFALTGHIDV